MEGGKVGLAAFDFNALLVSEVVGEEAALGLDHEVQAFMAIGVLDEDRPVGLVSPRGVLISNQPGSLADLDRVVELKLKGEGLLRAPVEDDVLVDRLLGVIDEIAQGAGEFLLLEELLRVVFVVADSLVLMPATMARRLRRLTASAAVSMNCCGGSLWRGLTRVDALHTFHAS